MMLIQFCPLLLRENLPTGIDLVIDTYAYAAVCK